MYWLLKEVCVPREEARVWVLCEGQPRRMTGTHARTASHGTGGGLDTRYVLGRYRHGVTRTR